jgi:hypothetical protein
MRRETRGLSRAVAAVAECVPGARRWEGSGGTASRGRCNGRVERDCTPLSCMFAGWYSVGCRRGVNGHAIAERMLHPRGAGGGEA